MKTNILLKLLVLILILSCDKKSNTTFKEQAPLKKVEQFKEEISNTKKIEKQQKPDKAPVLNNTDGLVLHKTNLFRNEKKPGYIYYKSRKDSIRYSFHTETSIEYGVLEKNYNDLTSTDYFIFSKPKNLDSTLVLHLKDTLFTKTHKEMDPEYEEYSGVEALLQDYFIVAFMSDASYVDAASIHIKDQRIRRFGSVNKYEVLPEQKSLKIWGLSDKKVKMDTICPELLKVEGAYYELGEAFIYELATGKKTPTGEFSCMFIQ